MRVGGGSSKPTLGAMSRPRLRYPTPQAEQPDQRPLGTHPDSFQLSGPLGSWFHVMSLREIERATSLSFFMGITSRRHQARPRDTAQLPFHVCPREDREAIDPPLVKGTQPAP